jgi:hypothetical protein
VELEDEAVEPYGGDYKLTVASSISAS